LVIACVQGLVGGIIFALLGLDAALFWGVCMAFCAIIPVVGTTIIWGPAAVFLMLNGHLVQGLILAGCGFGVIGMMDNILRPILLQGKVPMNLLLMFLSILGGISLFGFVGLILGPVVIAAAVSLVDILKTDPAEVKAGEIRKMDATPVPDEAESHQKIPDA
jgi:predicted PurR-regulated permease PerM